MLGCGHGRFPSVHLLHQNARSFVFPRTMDKRIDTVVMFVVRDILSRPGLLGATVCDLAAAGKIAFAVGADRDPLGFLVHPGGAASL